METGNVSTAPEAPGSFQSQQPLHHVCNWPWDHLVLITATQASLCEGNRPSFLSL
ncbi:rCG50444, partial [Rattus norvegicus]